MMPVYHLSAIGMILLLLFVLPSCGSSSPCDDGEEVFNGQCVRICPDGYSRGADGTCYPGGSGGAASGEISWGNYLENVGDRCYSKDNCSFGEECIGVGDSIDHGYCVTLCPITTCGWGICVDHAIKGEETDGRCWDSETETCQDVDQPCGDDDRICTRLTDGNHCLRTCDPEPNECENSEDRCLPYSNQYGSFGGGFCYDLPIF